MLDSLTLVQNETKVLEIEKKYNNAKIREENELLKITQQRNTIIIIIAISLFLLSVAGYIIYRQRSKAKIYYQQTILCINILDTPGHQDFSEDTYRTLMAADSAVMVIDASKGVEAQTRKLFKVCVMRHIPIFTFINKMDRDANDTFELLDDIEKELGIATCPINWPIGSGKQFKGVYDRNSKEVMTFADTLKGTKEGSEKIIHIDDPALSDEIGEEFKSQLMDEIELLDGASADFDMELVTKGELSPVFFGSALTNFGVETFLQHFLKMTYAPTSKTI